MSAPSLLLPVAGLATAAIVSAVIPRSASRR